MTAGRKVNSQSQDWCTPIKYVQAVRDMFDDVIELDPCSNKCSIVNARVEFQLPDIDGLNKEWNYKTIYVNPPYGANRNRGTTIKNWLKKCAESHAVYSSEILVLIPVATNTSHWKEYVFKYCSAICFLYDTRLKFRINKSELNKGAPMAICMVYYGSRLNRFKKIFSDFGSVINLK